MSVHIPESPLKYGLFGLFLFLAGVCISACTRVCRPFCTRVCASMHTGVQTQGVHEKA